MHLAWPFHHSRFYILYNLLKTNNPSLTRVLTTMLCKNYEKIVKIGIIPLFHKQCKTPFRDDMARLNIISLYIYKDLRLKSLGSSESRGHYLEDGNLVPSPRCGFSFEAAFQL